MSFQPKRILLGVDFSDCGTAALKYAKRLAASFRARLIVVHADEPPWLPSTGMAMEESVERGRELLRRVEAYLREQVGPEFAPFIRILHVPPAEAILWTCRLEKCDLIVVGTHGRGGLSRLTLGSVAERVLRQSDVPVLTVRAGSLFWPEQQPLRRILCPVNYSSLAGKALDHAVALARKFGAELTVLYLIDSGEEGLNLQAEAERLRVWAGEEVARLGGTQFLIGRGDAAEQVMRYALRQNADLIVIGAQHRRFADVTVIGSTTERITRNAPCPVLAVIEPIGLHEELSASARFAATTY